MPINQLVEYCNEHHNRIVRCGDCPNETCLNGCIACLEYIHSVRTHDRTYNCENIIFCYTCKFIFRYSTEIEYLLNLYTGTFRNAQLIRLWSIGCGPCTELFGLYNFQMNNNLNFTIQYKGFDLSTLWRPIHEHINQMEQFQTTFYYEDVFSYADKTEERPNLIILNYILSDILRTNRDYIDEFVDKLCNFYTQIGSAFLIINDINLGENNDQARYYYSLIIRRIREKNNLRHEGFYHFVNSQKSYYRYGKQHVNNQVRLIPEQNILDTYAPWMECRSSQLVIFKHFQK